MSEKTIPVLSDSIEKPKVSLLFDDYASIVRALNRSDLKDKGFLAVCCTSVEEVLSAIIEHDPQIIFLDNSLSPGGNEGLELVPIVRERWPNIKIYTTTNNSSVWQKYQELGIELVEKDLGTIAAKLKD